MQMATIVNEWPINGWRGMNEECIFALFFWFEWSIACGRKSAKFSLTFF
jgi:hypothetical protein